MSSSGKKTTPAVQSKYTKWITEEGLLLIEGWARDGLIDVDIAHNMGIVKSTLYRWINRYPEIAAAMSQGKEVADRRVENALFKRAIGYDYEETKTTVVTRDGKPTKDAQITKTKKHVSGDVTAQIIWLKNRKRPQWGCNESTPGAGAGSVEDLKPLAELLRLKDGE
jgi:hypothetical protein